MSGHQAVTEPSGQVAPVDLTPASVSLPKRRRRGTGPRTLSEASRSGGQAPALVDRRTDLADYRSMGVAIAVPIGPAPVAAEGGTQQARPQSWPSQSRLSCASTCQACQPCGPGTIWVCRGAQPSACRVAMKCSVSGRYSVSSAPPPRKSGTRAEAGTPPTVSWGLLAAAPAPKSVAGAVNTPE